MDVWLGSEIVELSPSLCPLFLSNNFKACTCLQVSSFFCFVVPLHLRDLVMKILLDLPGHNCWTLHLWKLAECALFWEACYWLCSNLSLWPSKETGLIRKFGIKGRCGKLSLGLYHQERAFVVLHGSSPCLEKYIGGCMRIPVRRNWGCEAKLSYAARSQLKNL
jgi:hypothetical protein